MTLQEHLDAVRADKSVVPAVELGKLEELTQALILRRAGLTYGAIAVVMRTYHGSSRSEEGWRGACRRMGATPKHYGASYGRRLAPQQRPEAQS